MELPELVELRKEADAPPQLLLLGAEILGNKVYAPGYITLEEAVSASQEFEWEGWIFRVTEDLPSKTAAIVPLFLQDPIELEIVKWPTKS